RMRRSAARALAWSAAGSRAGFAARAAAGSTISSTASTGALTRLMRGLLRFLRGHLLSHLGSYFFHVEAIDGVVDLLQLTAVERARLREHEDVLPERHARGYGADTEACGEFRLRLGVDLAEDDVRVGLGRLL